MNKGEFNQCCNRSACDNGGAVYYNHSTQKFYCPDCAKTMNDDPYNKRDALRLYGHNLLSKLDRFMVPGKWNGDMSILFCAVKYVVQMPSTPTWWSAHHVGETRQGILVLNPKDGYTFLIDNKFGDGFYKVAIGNGSPGYGHKSAEVEWILPEELERSLWIDKPDWEGYKAEQLFHDEQIKKKDPEAYERIMALRSVITKRK